MVVTKLKRVKHNRSHHAGQKHVTLHHHHAKSFRIRHYGFLIVFLIGLGIFGSLLIGYRDQIIAGTNSSRDYVSDLFSGKKDFNVAVNSTYGFSLRFDQKTFFALASDHTSTTTKGADLGNIKDYVSVQMTPYSAPSIGKQTGLSINYHPEITNFLNDDALQDLAIKDSGISKNNVRVVNADTMTIDGHIFQRKIWRTDLGSDLIANINASFSIYTATINGHPMTIVISEGFGGTPGEHPLYEGVLSSIKFDTILSKAPTSSPVVARATHGPTLLDTILLSKIASAETKPDTTSATEKIAALYSPAVTKVYNAYCTDLKFDGALIAEDVCQAASGSGFFIGQDGLLATNGHVASMNAQDLTIYAAFAQSYYYGKSALLKTLLAAANFKDSDIPSKSTDKQAEGIVVDKIYGLPASKFELTNTMQNLLVDLGTKQPDTDRLVTVTKDRKRYDNDPVIAPATVKATNFRFVDGLDGFKASDVALIKVSGNNFPVVHLGTLDDIDQGQNLSILGFPGDASENGIVESKTSTATLTTGKVSSKKKASGSDKNLIETDTTIGHGNSGGPAFADSGKVIGIATYTADGSGSGGGVFNYVRDIKDLIDLAVAKVVIIDSKSQTQSEWETGMGYFYTAHYSKALKNFETVKKLYPNHNKVNEFIASSNKRIKAGEDVVDFPVVPVAIAAGIMFVGIIASIVVIILHRKKHKIYKAGVLQGSVSPMAMGSAPQIVMTTHNPVSVTPTALVELPGAPPTESIEPIVDSIAKTHSNMYDGLPISGTTFIGDEPIEAMPEQAVNQTINSVKQQIREKKDDQDSPKPPITPLSL